MIFKDMSKICQDVGKKCRRRPHNHVPCGQGTVKRVVGNNTLERTKRHDKLMHYCSWASVPLSASIGAEQDLAVCPACGDGYHPRVLHLNDSQGFREGGGISK